MVVAPSFESMTLVQRHRSVNTVLREELAGSVHALSIMAKTPQEWEAQLEKQGAGAPAGTGTPNCMGGDASTRQL